ncbi:MAG: rRNA maturation RNase YbeY [Planctomycetaceae bacterium]
MARRNQRARFVIAVANQQRVLRVDRRRIVDRAVETLTLEGAREAEISIALVDDAQIHEINRRYLDHDYPTDVISFLWEAASEPRGRGAGARTRRPRARAAADHGGPRGAGKRLEGEIIISAETARKNASRFDWRPADEVCLYLVHGLLHLCGYDDLSADERRVMRAREAAILAHWNLKPRYGGSQRK